jgi:hypothetical protein
MYYPKSQIKPNLYTNGGEYLLSTTNQEYTGYYFKTSTGQFYSGKNPNQKPNILLIPFPEDPITEKFAPLEFVQQITIQPSLTYQIPSSFQTRNIPQFNPNVPTQQEQQNGQYTRYFCKRNNESKYIEIDLNTFTLLSTQSPQIAWDLYTPASVLWQIQGDKNTVYASNQASVYSIEKNLQWYGFSQYFKGDFLKYYLGS